MKMRPIPIMLSGLLLLATACKKDPGEGGKAELHGVVMRQDVNAAGAPDGEAYPYVDQRVYIVYGDHDFYDDDVRTGPDGQYAFRWLRKGDYTVYVYGEQCDCSDDMVVVEQDVTIDDKKGVVTVPTLTALNY